MARSSSTSITWGPAAQQFVGPFDVFFREARNSARPNQVRITRVRIFGLKPGDDVAVSCVACRGSHRVGPITVDAGWVDVTPHHLIATSRSLVSVLVSGPLGKIGRFKEYALNPHTGTDRVVSEGCEKTPAHECAPTSLLGLGFSPESFRRPTCPQECIAMSRTTGFQETIENYTPILGESGVGRAQKVPYEGAIVAWEVYLGKPTRQQTSFFDAHEDGPAEAGIAVLRPHGGSPDSYELVASSPVEILEPYFGRRVSFSLKARLPVLPGDEIALVVPTWAPVLGVGFGNGTTWRASRPPTQCTGRTEQAAQRAVGSVIEYACQYQAHLMYKPLLSPET